MRISTDESQEGYKTFRAAKDAGVRIRVMLDGVEQKYCFMADTRERIVERAVLNEVGEVQVDPENPDQILTEIVSGASVTIRFEKGGK